MAMDGKDYTQPSLFDVEKPVPSADEISTREIGQFLRKNAARRNLREGDGGEVAPRIYWHFGTEQAFFERVPLRLEASPPIEARTSVFEYEPPQHEGQATVEWTLFGDDLPSVGSRFRVFDLKESKWIGSGRVEEERETVFAFIVAGLWADFYQFEKDCSGIVLVIFDHLRKS